MSASNAPLKVLLVDDSPMQIQYQQMLLADQGYELFTALDGEEAIEKARALQPDVILMDIEMPRMNGIESAKCIHAEASTAHIPIIMVSAQSDDTSMESAFIGGCSDYVTKPMHKADVLSKIQSLTGTRLQVLSNE